MSAARLTSQRCGGGSALVLGVAARLRQLQDRGVGVLRLVQEIQAVVAKQAVDAQVIGHMERLVQAAGQRLRGTVLCQQPLKPGRYLCYQDPTWDFVIMILAWGRGDATAIHDHGVWGIETVLQGSLKVTVFSDSETDPQPLHAFSLSAGGVMHNLPPARDVHKVEHCGDDQALSMHLYGRALTDNRTFIPGFGFKNCKLVCEDLCMADICRPVA